jgi:hypothetical protein
MISFDVGIKHLAFCLFEKDTDKIMNWGVIDLSEQEQEEVGKAAALTIEKCSFCKTKAFVCNDTMMYCKRHLKEKVENPFILSNSDINKLTVKEMLKIQQLIPDVVFPKNPKKEELKTNISPYIPKFCCIPVNVKEKKTNVSNISLIILGKNMKSELDKLHFGDLDTVIIENQLGPIATRMKTIQGMLAQYFIMKFPSLLKIECVSSQNKLKQSLTADTTNGSTSYKGRKQMSVDICKTMLTKSQQNEFLEMLEKAKKKDDLADSYLQGIYYLSRKQKQQQQSK